MSDFTPATFALAKSDDAPERLALTTVEARMMCRYSP